MVDHYEDEIDGLGAAAEGEDAEMPATRQSFEDELAKAEKSKASVNEFYGNITRFWTAEPARSWIRPLRPSDFRQYRRQTIHGRLGSR
jgi:hypothetical protein